MKVFKYSVSLFDGNNDKWYYKTGLIVSENKDKAEKEVYQHYEKETFDYVSPTVGLTEVDITKNIIIEDRL